MNREYTVEEFCHVADYLIKSVNDLSLSTDYICGFPGETDFEHKESVMLLNKYKIPFVNIS